MQHFPCPNHKLQFHKCNENILHKKSNKFKSIPFHSVHLFLPSTKDLSEDCKEILLSEEDTYFIVKQISLSTLINSVFLKNFVKKGSLCAISQYNENPQHFAALTSSGKLIIKLENNIAGYLSLLKEKTSHQNHKRKETHQTCIIDINSSDFAFDKKYYKLVVSELEKIDHIKFDLLLKWNPEGNICCQSIRGYFENQNIECIPCEPLLKQETTSYIPVPKIDFTSMNPLLIESILEWIGAQICNVKYSVESEKFVSKFSVPEHSENRKIIGSTYQGFFTSEKIHDSIGKVRNLFTKDPKIPFVALVFSGYQYCYVDSKETGQVTAADKFICILISPQFDYWMITLNL